MVIIIALSLIVMATLPLRSSEPLDTALLIQQKLLSLTSGFLQLFP